MRVSRPGVLATVALVVIGSGGYAYAQSRDVSPTYRTAAASMGNVERTLNLSGTVAASGRRDLGFSTSGTVASANVKAGQRVSAGQRLASLRTTAFDATVLKAEATLARAKAQLETDETAQTNSVTSGSGSSNSGSAGNPGSAGGGSPSAGVTTAQLAALKKQQNAVTAAQTAASSAIAAAEQALNLQRSACAIADPVDPTVTPTPSATSTPSPSPTPSPASGIPAGCTDALAAVQAAQEDVAAKQATLQSNLGDLAATLTAAIKGVTPGSGQAGDAGGVGGKTTAFRTGAVSSPSTAATSGASTGIGGSSSGSASSGTTEAGRIAADQAAIDTAQEGLIEARVARNAVALTAPFAGIVVAVNVAKGDAVIAGDTALVLVGAGEKTVTTTLSTTQIPLIRRGMTARVTPAGWTRSIRGAVTAIGLLPSTTTTGNQQSTTYPITITLDTSQSVAEGATAAVALVTGTAKNQVTVPSSAIHTLGSRTTVTVLSGVDSTTTPVTVGVVGTTRTSITSGLKAGEQVVLADLGAALPTDNTLQRGLRGFGGGGAGRGNGGGQQRTGGGPGSG